MQNLKELTRHLLAHEPEEIRALRTGTVPLHPGSYGQYFTTWDLANGILRDYAMNLYQLLRVAAGEDLSPEAVITVMQTWDPIYSNYLGYSGFPGLQQQAARVRQPPVPDRATLVASLSALTEYANRLAAWSHHYFPWSLGEHYRYETTSDQVPSPPPGKDIADACSSPARRVPLRLTWEPLGIEVTAEVMADLNEALCTDLLAALPFTVLQDHAVVSGQSMYAWAPLVSIAPTPITERICDAPAGRLRFSQATGNKLVIQYGPTTETLRVPVLGRVATGDLDVLAKVGRAVWDSTFRTKEKIWLTAKLAADPQNPGPTRKGSHDHR
jgi:hypothetical protein